MADQGHSGFLPPDPPGPEPDLGEGGQDPTQPLPPPAHGPPQQAQPPQHQPPPQQHYPQPPPQAWQQPYGYGPPTGYGYPPPQGWQQQPPGYPAWGPPPPREPDNNPAVAGFVLSLVGGGLLFFFAGLSTIVSLGLSIAGIVYSRKGRARVDEGETPKHRGLAQAGFIVGIVATVLSLLATIFWILFFVLLATDEDFRRDLEDNNSGTIAIALVKGVLGLLT